MRRSASPPIQLYALEVLFRAPDAVLLCQKPRAKSGHSAALVIEACEANETPAWLCEIGIEENIERCDLPITNYDHIQARIFGCRVARARAPSQTTGVVESLRFAVRCVNEVRVRRAQISCEFVESVVPDKYTRRHVEDAVLGIELLDCRATTRCVAFTKNLLEVAIEQLMGTVIARRRPCASPFGPAFAGQNRSRRFCHNTSP